MHSFFGEKVLFFNDGLYNGSEMIGLRSPISTVL